MIAMDKELFQKYTMEEERPVLVEFWAPWCAYCRRIAPALNQISEKNPESLVVGQVNIDEEPRLAGKEEIEVIPTLILYKKGQTLGSIVAPESRASIENFIRETLGE